MVGGEGYSLSRRRFLETLTGGVTGAALLASTDLASGAPAPAPSSETGVAEPDDEAYWRWVADQFLIPDDLAYLNTGTRGPSPRSVVQAQVEAIRQVDTDRLSYAKYVHNADFTARLREKLATYLGCKPNEVAFTNNTTEGMAFGTNGPDLKAGDQVICTNHDHSSGAMPIYLRAVRQGLEPVMIDLSDPKYHPPRSPSALIAAFDAAMTRRTRLISFCHLNYTDGCVLPVKQICELARSRGILTLVDGAHPPGLMKLDLHDLGCDMYAGACHKWMLASMLTGFFYVREDLQDRIWPSIYAGPVNGLSMYGEPAPERFKAWAETAARYELRGSGSYSARMSLDAALNFHNRLTPAAVEARDRYLARRAREGLRELSGVSVYVSEEPELSSGVVSFALKGVEPERLAELLWDRHRIYIRNVTHPEIGWDANRACLHLMVTVRQVDDLIGAVAEVSEEIGA